MDNITRCMLHISAMKIPITVAVSCFVLYIKTQPAFSGLWVFLWQINLIFILSYLIRLNEPQISSLHFCLLLAVFSVLLASNDTIIDKLFIFPSYLNSLLLFGQNVLHIFFPRLLIVFNKSK